MPASFASAIALMIVDSACALRASPLAGGRVGVLDSQRRRKILIAARTREQGKIEWDFVAGFAANLPLEMQRKSIFRRAPRLETEYEGDGGGHVLRVIAADDSESLFMANPGAVHGIGSSIDWLEAQAKRAIARGGSSLNAFRLYNRNERVSGETRDQLVTVDEWMACEVAAADLPPREGAVVIGIDLGGSAAMTAAAFYWPDTGRLECVGTFPARPSLLDRGQVDGVAGRYVEMQDRGELTVLGDKTVPVTPWLLEVIKRVDGSLIGAITMDRYKQAELGEAIDRAGIRAPFVWRGQGFKDGGEDAERFRRAVFDQKVKVAPSLLLRSAIADAVCLRDPANNIKIAKARSTGRIDAVSASVLAVAEGARIAAQPKAKARVIFG